MAVGVSDFEPRDQQEMSPAELNARRCGQVTMAVSGGEMVTLTCPTGGVTGRYLIVQALGRYYCLILCEVEAGMAILCYFEFLLLSQSSAEAMFSLPLL